MKRKLSFIMTVMSLLVSSVITVQAAGTSKQVFTFDQKEQHGYTLEIPNYIGETEDLKGYTLVDIENTGIMGELYGLSEWKDSSLSIFLLDSDEAEFPIKHLAYKEFGEHKAEGVEVEIDTAGLTFNGGNVEFTHNLTLGAENTIDKGTYFESTLSPYFVDSYVNSCFLFKINTYYINNGERFYYAYAKFSGIALTPSMADEVVKTGKFKGLVIPGLKEKIVEYRNGSPSDVSNKAAITVEVNGKDVLFDVPPQIVNGRTMVPLRSICEALDVAVEFNDKTNMITLKTGSTAITHTIGEKTLIKNGVSAEFDTASMIIGGRTLVPTRMIAEAIGAKVEWIDSSKTVKITTQ